MLHEAGIIAHQQGMKILYPQFDISEGLLRSKQGDLEGAVEKFDQAEALSQEMGLRPLLWKARAGLAGVFAAQGDDIRAQEKRGEAKTVVDEIALHFKDPELRRSYLVNAGKQLGS